MVVGNGNLYFCCCSIILDTKGKKNLLWNCWFRNNYIVFFINGGGRVNPIQITLSKTSLKSGPYYKLNALKGIWKWNEANLKQMKKKKKKYDILFIKKSCKRWYKFRL